MEERYDLRLAAACVRGAALRGALELDAPLLDAPLDALTAAQCEALMAAGRAAGLSLHDFKLHDPLPRVKKALGFLRAVQPESLLDVGSGRGVFLFPFLRQFPQTPVTALDLLPRRVRRLDDLRAGGVASLTAVQADLCDWDAPDKRFDAVSLLEVLEHIPDVAAAVKNAVRLARRYVVVSVPSKPDDNPEHIHLLTKPVLTGLFARAGCENLKFDGVNNHLVMTARL